MSIAGMNILNDLNKVAVLQPVNRSMSHDGGNVISDYIINISQKMRSYVNTEVKLQYYFLWVYDWSTIFLSWQAIMGLSLMMVMGVVAYAAVHRWSQKGSKDPKTWPIIGSHLEAVKNYNRILEWTTDFFSDDHRTVKMWFLSRSSYVTVDPANVEYILKTNFENFPKGEEMHKRLFDFLGNGILNTDGQKWRNHRKIASHEFSIKKLRHLSATVYKQNALKLAEQLSALNGEASVDIQQLLQAMTFDSICQVVLGVKELPSLSGGGSSIADAIDNAQEMVAVRYVAPWWRLVKVLNIGWEKVLRQEMCRFRGFLDQVIRQRKLDMRKSTSPDQHQDQNLLTRFLLSSAPASSKLTKAAGMNGERNNDNIKDDEEVKDAMVNLLMAGRDTTASTLSWFLYCMCSNPNIQANIFQEVRALQNLEESVVNMNDYAQLLTYDAVQNRMPYLHAAIAETLRLYPAVPRDGKIALKDDVLPDGTRVKRGDQVIFMPYAMGRMPFLWGEDAHQFKPQRWLVNVDGKLVFRPESPFKFTAFQAGPRMCLGKDAAYLQMKITAAILLRFFRFELVPLHVVKYRAMAVMTMKYGLRIKAIPRA